MRRKSGGGECALAHVLTGTIAALDAPVDARAGSADAQRSWSGTAWGPEAEAVHLHAAGDVEQAERYLLRAGARAAAPAPAARDGVVAKDRRLWTGLRYHKG